MVSINYITAMPMLASIVSIISNNCEEAGFEKKFQCSDGHWNTQLYNCDELGVVLARERVGRWAARK